MEAYGTFCPTQFDRAGAFLPDRSSWIVLPWSMNRDSRPLEVSNFETAWSKLREAEECERHRFGHWANGWFELILIRPGTEAETLADGLIARMNNYPCLDEDDCSRRERDEALQTWAHCYSLRERVDLCREFGVSIFAARRTDELPQDDGGRLFERLMRD